MRLPVALLLSLAAVLPACKPAASPAASAPDTTSAPPAAPAPIPAPSASDTSVAASTTAPGASAAAPASPAGSPAPAAGGASVRPGSTFGYAVPAGWRDTQPNPAMNVRMLMPPFEGKTTIVVAESPARVRSLEDVKLGVRGEIAQMAATSGMTVVEQGDALVAGRPAYRLHLRGTVQDIPVELLAVNWHLPSGHPLQATLTVPTRERSLASVRATFDTFAESFVFAPAP